MTAHSPETEHRKAWMSLLAKTPAERLTALWEATSLSPDHEILRAPEVGAVMVRGRAGATGAPFNLGEMSVVRCSVRLACGTVGHGYVQGRDKEHARLAALVDALMQTRDAARLRADLLTPLEAELTQARTARQARAAATKVDFFTLVRGED
ncbi:MAG: phosphonate C-P lyase system protein PhnG [Pseudomonadota bacterium]